VNDLICAACGREGRTGPVWPARCLCGGLWSAATPELYPTPGVDEEGVIEPVPLWPDPLDPELWWKREDLNGTGSFKDRGATVLAAVAEQAGARRLVLDSSGSAALAAASAAARSQLPLTVHAPGTLPRAKREALEVLGATVVAAGNRGAASARAQEAAEREFYFSHVYHPAFFEGTAQSGVEVLEQTGGAPPPVWVLPVGNGSLFLGLALVLARVGIGDAVRLVAVQAEACPGLRAPGGSGRTEAAGIGIADPPRREEILVALSRHRGEIVEVTEEEIAAARESLGRRGVAAERAAAAAEAGVRRLRAAGEDGPILAWLTGSGHRGG
jgi:threonine synthase